MEIVFVVLHYMAINDTKECVESIRAHTNRDSYHIVIVDNSSPDHSGAELLQEYGNCSDVTVLLTEENLGFARGNNYGIAYALKNFDFRYCAAINNDTLLIEDGLIEKLNEETSKSNFAVLGPMILTADGRCDSNPVRDGMFDEEYVVNELKSETRHYKAEKNPVIRFFRNIWFLVKPLFESHESEGKKDFLTRREDVQLHGSFLVFSKKFFEHYSGFCDETFLYHEEEILQLIVYRAGLAMVYDPDIKVFHKEDASTNAIESSKHEKRERRLKNSVESLEILKKIYEEGLKEN